MLTEPTTITRTLMLVPPLSRDAGPGCAQEPKCASEPHAWHADLVFAISVSPNLRTPRREPARSIRAAFSSSLTSRRNRLPGQERAEKSPVRAGTGLGNANYGGLDRIRTGDL